MTRQFAAACAAFFAFLSLFLLPASAATPTPPVMRLGNDVRPLAHDVELMLDPAQAGFTGKATIEVELARPLDFFWVNGTGIQLAEVRLVTESGRSIAATPTVAGTDFIGLRFAETIPAGSARLVLAWSGTISDRETRGLFRQRERGEWYVFSQFESTNLRRVMPGFDEPQWKTPWTLSLVVPASQVAAANTPILSEEALPGTDRKRVRFARSKPLPSYLVAMAIGPFDVVDGGHAGRNKVPVRYLVPKGRAAEAAYARQATPALVDWLENYFGTPYPFEKLDSVAIPITLSFAAMENPGLVTYRSDILLAPPERADERFQQRYAAIAAHEVAHMWFGNLVTMTWWNDIWLNEAFATWMARKTLRAVRPDWEWHPWQERERLSAARVDRLSMARRIRQDVNNRDDLGNAFDRITYDKGGAVLTMYESWLGEAAFRDGVRRYMAKHAWGNASAEDFFAAMAQADPTVVAGFSSFVHQAGLPLVDAKLECAAGQASVLLRQQRFVPARPDAAGATRWTLPVCMRVEGQDAGKPFCTLLREETQRVALPATAGRCPAWLLPNPGGVGYFLSSFDAPRLERLARATLAPHEAAALLGDVSLLVQSGALPASRLLALAGALAGDARPDVVQAAALAVTHLHPALLDDTGRRDLPAWIRRHFGGRAAELGWIPRPGESDAVRKLRFDLVELVGLHGEDAALRAQAQELAREWLAGRNMARLGAMYRPVLRAAAAAGDASFYEAMESAARAADGRRSEILRAMAFFRAPALRERAFAFALSDAVDAREGIELLSEAGQQPATADALLAFVERQQAALVARLPESVLARMPQWHAGLCSAGGRERLEALYGPAAGRYAGAARNLALAAEQAAICARAASVHH